MRLVHTEEEQNEQVEPSYPYYEEIQDIESQEIVSTIPTAISSSQEVEALFQMDHNTLMFVAQGGMNKPMPS